MRPTDIVIGGVVPSPPEPIQANAEGVERQVIHVYLHLYRMRPRLAHIKRKRGR